MASYKEVEDYLRFSEMVVKTMGFVCHVVGNCKAFAFFAELEEMMEATERPWGKTSQSGSVVNKDVSIFRDQGRG